MKRIVNYIFILVFAGLFMASAQNVGIGTATPHPKAVLHLEDSTRALLVPRMTTTQRDTMTNLTEGLVIYNITTHCLEFWNGSQWISTCASSAPCVPPPPPVPSSNSPVCTGQDINLTASTITGATYIWTGPNSFYSTNQNPTIASATMTDAGVYCVRAYVAGCYSKDTCTTVNVIAPPGTWTLKAQFPYTYPVYGVSGFAVNNNLYIVDGRRRDLPCCKGSHFSLKYNIITNTWTNFALCPLPDGIDGQYRCGFSDGTFGYIVGGGIGSASPIPLTNKTYRYNPITNTWIQRANYTQYDYAIHRNTVVVNNKAYTFGGEWDDGTSTPQSNDIREYSILSNSWTNVGSIGGINSSPGRGQMFVFAINDTIYYGCGADWMNSPATPYAFVYRYIPTTNTHTYLGTAPFNGVTYAYFSIGRKGYVFDGTKLYEYNPDTNTWTELCTPVKDAPDIAFSVNGKAYIIDTDDDNGDGTKEFWEWTP